MQNFVQPVTAEQTVEVQGNNYTLKKHDPYGFWTVHLEKGKVAAELNGSYTEAAYAEKAIEAYLANNGAQHKKITKPKVPLPEA